MPAPTLGRVSPADMSADLKAAWQSSMDLRGDATFMEVSANHEDLFRWYVNSFYGEVFNKGLVDRRYKELGRLRLSQTHGCRFCNQGNSQDALAAGVSQDQIDRLYDYENGPFDDREKALLRLADQIVLTNPDGHLTPELYADVSQHFSDAEIYELGLVMGILAGVAKFLFVFDLVEREPNCPFPGPS